MSVLGEIKASLAKLTASSKANNALDYLTQYIDAQRAGESDLDQRMRDAQQQKEPPKKKKVPVSHDIDDLLRELRKQRRRK